MSAAVDVVFIAVGVALIAISRLVADHLKVEGDHHGVARTFIRMGGLADDHPSQLYRWVVCVVTGAVFIGIGVVGLIHP